MALPTLSRLQDALFSRIEVDGAWVHAVQEADARGIVVYVLRNLSPLDSLALGYLTQRHGLPEVAFSNDSNGRWWGMSSARSLFPFSRGTSTECDAVEQLRQAIRQGSSAALFLKRPATLLEPKVRGKVEGDSFVRALFELQRELKRPILLVPQVFVWSKAPDDADYTWMDSIIGRSEWPGVVRSLGQFASSYHQVTLRAGQPVDVRAFLATEENDGDTPVPDDVLVRRLTYTLLRRLERERRAVLGPARKSAERLRTEVVRSPKLAKIITDMAGDNPQDREVFARRAFDMLRELEASLDVSALAALNRVFERLSGRMFTDVELDREGLERVRNAAKDGTIILLPSHKSHVDYMVMSHIFYRNHLQLPLIAAGDNLNFFPMGALFRRAGAFFIRRTFRGDKLYAAVVDAYIRRLIKDGWPLEFFLEGGRSRSGKLLRPQVGILNMVVDAALGVMGRNVYFCPVSIGYERVAEEKSFVFEASGGEKRKEDFQGLLSSAGVVIGQYGRVNVQFGEILTLEGVLREFEPLANRESLAAMTPARRRAVVTRLAYRVLHEINRVTAVTAGALVATALLTHGRRGISHGDLVDSCQRLGVALHRLGARFSPSLWGNAPEGTLRPEALAEACELFLRAGHIKVRRPGEPLGTRSKSHLRPSADSVYVVPDERRMALDLSKNILVHFFLSRGLLATVLLSVPSLGPLDGTTLRERVLSLARYFKHEFTFRADVPFEKVIDEEIEAMVRDGELAVVGSGYAVAPGEGLEAVRRYAGIVRNFLEGYRVAARTLHALLRGALLPQELSKKAISVGERMFLDGTIAQRESVARAVFENAFLAFADQGYLVRKEGKYALPESLASSDAVGTIEHKLVAFLNPSTDQERATGETEANEHRAPLV